MNGVNYVPYSPVQAFSAPNDNTIPSGSYVGGTVYYAWDDNGFTGVSWFVENYSGAHPLRDNTYKKLNSAEVIEEYLLSPESGGTLNNIFKNWHPSMDQYNEWNHYIAQNATGCATPVW